MDINKNKISTIFTVGIILVFYSCSKDNNSDEVNDDKSVQIVTSTVDRSYDTDGVNNSPLVELGNFKNDLDSFVINTKKTVIPFELRTDTINSKSSDRDLWDFKKGLFKLISVDSTDVIIRHHFSIPNTDRLLRINLLVLQYDRIEGSALFFKKLESRKDYKADLTEGYFLDYGLTGTTDYVIKLDESILWLNISCQYSIKEFDKLIQLFRQNIVLTENERIIKCFCQKGCK